MGRWKVEVDRLDNAKLSIVVEVTKPAACGAEDCEAVNLALEYLQNCGLLVKDDPSLDFGVIYDPIPLGQENV